MILETAIETKNTHPHYPQKRNLFFLNGKWSSQHKNKLANVSFLLYSMWKQILKNNGHYYEYKFCHPWL